MEWLRRILSLWVNLSPSLPIGVYHVVQRPVDRGAIIVVCLPTAIGTFARARDYLGRGPCPGGVEYLGKRVAGIPGDTIKVAADGVRINGFLIPNSRPLSKDSRGRPLMRAEGGVVKVGEVFLLATDHPRSFDSRYFGAIAVAPVVVVR